MPPDSHQLSRRSVLWLGGGVVVLAVGVGAGVITRLSGDDENPIGPAGPTSSSPSEHPSTTAAPVETTTTTIAPLVPADVPAGVLAIGAAYLAERPDEDLASLLAALPAPDGDVVTAAREAVASDFEAGATVDVDGWVLSHSEARAAAVLAMICTDEC